MSEIESTTVTGSKYFMPANLFFMFLKTFTYLPILKHYIFKSLITFLTKPIELPRLSTNTAN